MWIASSALLLLAALLAGFRAWRRRVLELATFSVLCVLAVIVLALHSLTRASPDHPRVQSASGPYPGITIRNVTEPELRPLDWTPPGDHLLLRVNIPEYLHMSAETPKVTVLTGYGITVEPIDWGQESLTVFGDAEGRQAALGAFTLPVNARFGLSLAANGCDVLNRAGAVVARLSHLVGQFPAPTHPASVSPELARRAVTLQCNLIARTTPAVREPTLLGAPTELPIHVTDPPGHPMPGWAEVDPGDTIGATVTIGNIGSTVLRHAVARVELRGTGSARYVEVTVAGWTPGGESVGATSAPVFEFDEKYHPRFVAGSGHVIWNRSTRRQALTNLWSARGAALGNIPAGFAGGCVLTFRLTA